MVLNYTVNDKMIFLHFHYTDFRRNRTVATSENFGGICLFESSTNLSFQNEACDYVIVGELL